MRVFTTVEFDDETKNKISLLQKEIREICPKGRWKHRDNFHLTVKFLGEVDEKRLRNIKESLEKASCESHEFNLSICSLGCFGGPPLYKVLWLGVTGELDKLKHLFLNVENQLSLIGFEKENRPYSPHVTIAQDIEIPNSIEKLKEKVFKHHFETMKIDRLVLMKSEQLQNKRIYTTIGAYDLGR